MKKEKFETIILEKPLDPPRLVFGDGEYHDPILGLEYLRYKPYKVDSRIKERGARLLVLVPTNLEKDQKILELILKDLIDGMPMDERYKRYYIRSRWWGYGEVYGINLEYEIEKYSWQQGDISSLVKKIKEEAGIRPRNYDLILIYLPLDVRSPLGGPYYRIKAQSILNKIQTQILLRKNLYYYGKCREKRNTNLNEYRAYGDFLWNFSLSIFVKLGGIPWRLKEVIPNIAGFIGLATIVTSKSTGRYEKSGIAAVQIYNAWGEYVTSARTKIAIITKGRKTWLDPEKIKDLVLSVAIKIKSFPRVDMENNYVIIHVTDLYKEEVKKTMVEAVKDVGFKKVKLIRVQEEGSLRLYNQSREKSVQRWPPLGTYWFLEEKRLAQLFTTGKWQYMPPPREPYSIPWFTCSPIQISLEGPLEEELTKHDLKCILWLTYLHPYSGDLPRIRMPVNLRMARRLAKIVASEDLGEQEIPDISYLY